MNNFMPRVSIIIPVYNGSNYLREAIESALNQTYQNIEVIVINDGSDDGGKTQQIIDAYGSRIRSCTKCNGGVAAALNMGIKMMTGEYFSWLSHDDVYLPNKIIHQINFLSKIDNQKTIIYTGYQLIDQVGRIIGVFDPMNEYGMLKYSHPLFPVFRLLINGCTLLIHKQLILENGIFDETLLTTQDYDMWYRLFRNNQVVYNNVFDVLSRVHEQQGSKKNITFHVEECETLWIKMLESLTYQELRAIDGTSITFLENTYKLLKEKTLYYKVIKYLEDRLCNERKCSEIQGTQKIKVRCFNPNIQQIISNLPKTKPRMAYYKMSKRGLGGLESMSNKIIDSLVGAYELIVLLSGEYIENGYEYVNGIHYICISHCENWKEEIVQLFINIQVDIFIGSHNYLEYFIELYKVLKANGIRCIAWNHEDYFFSQCQPQYQWIVTMRHAVYKTLDRVVWINRRSMEAYAKEASNGWYIPNGVKNDRSEGNSCAKELNTLIAVGRFEDEIKQVYKLLEVFHLINRQLPDAKLYIVGNANGGTPIKALGYKTIEEYIKDLDIPPSKVIFTGWVEDVSLYYRKAMVQLCTSKSEGFGLTIPEASKYGVPTVSFRNGGAEDMIINGLNGYLVDDVFEMAQKSIQLLADKNNYDFIKSNVEGIVHNFSEESMIMLWHMLIQNIVK